MISPEEAKKAIPSINVSLLVATNNGLFCSTDEFYGWYLPAGRVDFGETFDTAAKREAVEEAGLVAKLTGILRFEYSFSFDSGTSEPFFRIRCVFSGVPEDPNKPLKSIADDETYGAAWLSIADLVALSKQEKNVLQKLKDLPYRIEQSKIKKFKQRKDKLRAKEVIHLFKWLESGTRSFPLEIFSGTDANDKFINHEKVDTSTCYFVQLIITSEEADQMYHEIPRVQVGANGKDFDFHDLAASLCKHVEAAKFQGKSALHLNGICSIFHVASNSKLSQQKNIAKFTVTFHAVSNNSQGNEGFWQKLSDINLDENNHYLQEEKHALKNLKRNLVAPLDFLAWEGSNYIKIE